MDTVPPVCARPVKVTVAMPCPLAAGSVIAGRVGTVITVITVCRVGTVIAVRGSCGGGGIVAGKMIGVGGGRIGMGSPGRRLGT